MSVFEITIRRKEKEPWPVVVMHQPPTGELAIWTEGLLSLDPGTLDSLLPQQKKYGLLLGKALFAEELRDAFVRAVAEAKAVNDPLRVLLNVEADDLRCLHWEQLHAPMDRGWDYLLLNQGTPFSIYLPSHNQRRFPPIGRRDLSALVLVTRPEELDGDYGLASFDADATVGGIQHALGEIPCDVLAQVEGRIGPPSLKALCEHLTAGSYTVLHIVCHGKVLEGSDETILYIPEDESGKPVLARDVIEWLSRLDRLPHFAFLSTCDSADPQAEAGLGGLGQRLVRDLGMPAVVAMTDRISIATAGALASAFYPRLREHGEVDRALCEALAGLQGRYDVTVPALFSRLGGHALWSDTLDRALTDAEIRHGLERLPDLLEQRAPVLLPEFEEHSTRILASLGAKAAALSTETRRERDAALAAVNQLCSEALDLSFNALALGHKPPDYDARCPFPGISAFGARFLASGEVDQDDRAFFFGREALVERLKEKLAGHNFLPILGPSGSGKSSLVIAGLIPALQKEEPHLQMAYLTPGSHPQAQLEASRSNMESEHAVLVVDQFEELFTLCADEEERQAFLDHLLALVGEIRVVIAMRAGFWGECAPYPALKAEMQARQELIAPMDVSELRAAMERQAAEVGLRFEADLSNTMLDDVRGEPGAMPLLQHALRELWNRRHGRWLLAEEYRRKIGGAQQAIAHTADALYRDLSPEERERMRDIFLRLTRLGDEVLQGEEWQDTRQRVRFEELVPADGDPAPIQKLVQRLADARLIVTGPWATPAERQTVGDSPVKVEVAHEALIRYWPRLRTWLDENRAGLRLREDIRRASLDWQASDEDETFLVHRGGRLEDAEALAKEPKFALNELEQAYVQACVDLREQEQREKEDQQRRELKAARDLAKEQKARAEDQADNAARMRRRAMVIGAVGVVALVLAGLSMFFWQQAQANARRAQDNAATATANLATADVASTRAVANAVAAQANADVARGRELAALATKQLDGRLDLALLLAIASFRHKNLLQTRQALFQAWCHKPQLSHFLHRHSDGVNTVAWSADGQLASGSDDGTVIVWDLEQGLPFQTLTWHHGSVNSLAWSADGRLASGSSDDTVIVWDLEQGLPDQTLGGHTGDVNSAAWSVDGQLASGSDDGTVIVWDLEQGLPDQTLTGHQGPVNSLAWSAAGRLASGSSDDTVIFWDLERGVSNQILGGHASDVHSVAWSADGRLASGSSDDTVIVWDLEQGLPDQTLGGHEDWVHSVAWSVDGRLASGSWDNTVIVWDLERGVPVQTLGRHFRSVNSVAWSEDGQLAFGSDDGTVVIWDLAKASLGRGVSGQTLAGHTRDVNSVAWSANGRLASGSDDGTVVIWDLEPGLPAQILEGHQGPVNSVAWSTAGQLASGSSDNTVIVWDLEQGLPAQSLEEHQGAVNGVGWSADGWLASGSSDDTVIVWDLEQGQPYQILEGHVKSINSVAWSVDGRLASGSWDNTVIVWDLERGLPDQTLAGHQGPVNSVAWSADGRLASGSSDDTVIVWDLERGVSDQTLGGHAGDVNGVAWSADGRLASGSSDDSVIVWDLEQGLPDQTLGGHARDVNSVAWSVDGRLASGSWDYTVQVWITDPEEWSRQACHRAGRNLTRAEWQLYFPDEEYRKTCDQWPEGK